MNYDIRDISLAPSGHRKIEWVKNNMPLLSALEADFRAEKPFGASGSQDSISLQGAGSRRSPDVGYRQQQPVHTG